MRVAKTEVSTVTISLFNTEEYAAIPENGFRKVATDPLSTFSADVDTASYCNLRRMLNNGWSPESIPAGAVRVEEMLNYFRYDYAAPAEGGPGGGPAPGEAGGKGKIYGAIVGGVILVSKSRAAS